MNEATRPEAYLLVAEHHHRSVYIDHTAAVLHIPDHHHAILLELVRADMVLEMMQAACADAYQKGRRDEHEAEMLLHPVIA